MIKISLLAVFTTILLGGCAQSSLPQDADKDGVPDYMDICKNTPALVLVDKFGCALDADRDGVINIYDKCPNTPFLATVNSNGCTAN